MRSILKGLQSAGKVVNFTHLDAITDLLQMINPQWGEKNTRPCHHAEQEDI
jgi:hypothetical protein